MRSRRARLLFAVCILLVSAAANAATPGYVEDFNGGLGNWQGGAVETIVSSGGVGGAGDGYLEVALPDFAGYLGVFNDGPDFNGDLLADGVTGFSFWLSDVGQDDDLEIHVGVGVAFVDFWLSIDGFAPPEAGSWAEFSVDITDESGWVQIIGSGSFADALANSDHLLFRHDFPPLIQPPDTIQGEFGLDRVTVLPEPAAGLALLLAGVLVARRRR